MDDLKFDDLGEYLQSHFQKKIVNDISEANIPMHDMIFCCG